MYILAGKKKLQEVRTTKLPELLNKAQRDGLPEDAQAARDLDSMCNRFEKKIHDLELTRTISIQTAPQIRLVQGNDTHYGRKDPVHDSKYHTIVEESDGSGSRCGAFGSGSSSSARSDRHDKSAAA